jgi:hypothetical protein
MSQPNTPTTSAPAIQPASATATASPPITSASKTSGKVPKLQIQASFQALVSGLLSTYQPSDTFSINGETLTRDEVTSRLNAYIATAEATKASRQQWLSAVEAEHAGLVAVTPLRQSLHAIVQARLGGKDATGLTAFGFSPAKSTKRTVTSKATAVAKTAATREARHTMGKVQKQGITGDVVGITVTPLVAGPPIPAPSAPTAPSSTTPSGAATASTPAATSNH